MKRSTRGAIVAALVVSGACQSTYTTRRDNTARGAGIGAAAGATAALLAGEREADEVLAGAAIGAGIGAGVGAYMDHQEEKLARIPGTTVERVGEDALLVRFASDVLFEIDSARLDASAQGILGQVAEVIVDFPKTAVVVQGHTDATGSEEHNQRLSERRANSVRGYLINRGVDASRLVAVGYGESMPVADNSSESGRRRNRRVNILLKAKAR
jgi:outer membrane protein OmpA-like peptidoglycan-associated protein